MRRSSTGPEGRHYLRRTFGCISELNSSVGRINNSRKASRVKWLRAEVRVLIGSPGLRGDFGQVGQTGAVINIERSRSAAHDD